MKTNNFEQKLDEALNLQKKGLRNSEILDMFPEYREELKDILSTTKKLNDTENIYPQKDALLKVLNNLPKNDGHVTKPKTARYIFIAIANKGRNLINNFNTLINMTKKTFIGAGATIALILAIGLIFTQQNNVGESSPELAMLTEESTFLKKDIELSKDITDDKSLDSLDDDLSILMDGLGDDIGIDEYETTDEQNNVDSSDEQGDKQGTPNNTYNVSEIEDLETELEDELDGLLDDLDGLDQVGEDSSFDYLDSDLEGIG